MKTNLFHNIQRPPFGEGLGWGAIARSACIALACLACHEEALDDHATETIGDVAEYTDMAIAFTDGRHAEGILPLSAGDLTTAKLTAMTVYAHYTGANNFATATGSTPNFMFNQSVTKSDGAWSYTPLKYWPAGSGKVSFFAVAPEPVEANGITLAKDAYTGYPAFVVTPPAMLAQQQDICVASALDRTGSGGQVPLTFNHAMAKLTFTAQYFLTNQTSTTLQQLKFADIYTSSTLTFDGAGLKWDNSSATKGTYTLSVGDNTLSVGNTTTVTNGQIISGAATTVEGTLMLIPQTLDGAKAEMTLSNGTVETINMPQLTLEAGKQYTYNLTNVNAFNKPQWTATVTSTFNENTPVSNLFDNDPQTIWHSTPTQNTDPSGLPQAITVDMGGYKLVDGFYIVHVQSASSHYCPKVITIETSLDGTSWTSTSYTSYPISQEKTCITLSLDGSTVIRYFKVAVSETNPGASYWVQFAELGAYNTAEPAPSLTLIEHTAPVGEHQQWVNNSLTFSWTCQSNDAIPTNYTLKLSDNPNMTDAREYSVSGLSKEVPAADLASLLGDNLIKNVYWTVSATDAISPVPRDLALTKVNFAGMSSIALPLTSQDQNNCTVTAIPGQPESIEYVTGSDPHASSVLMSGINSPSVAYIKFKYNSNVTVEGCEIYVMPQDGIIDPWFWNLSVQYAVTAGDRWLDMAIQIPADAVQRLNANSKLRFDLEDNRPQVLRIRDLEIRYE
jgi:hypothetical protein